MSRFKPSTQRRAVSHRIPVVQPHERMLTDRAYLELSRPGKLRALPKLRPPYLEAIATALAFAFLIYLVLGGA